MNATWRAWREAFFDLIAGKPHLPSVTVTTQPSGTSEPVVVINQAEAEQAAAASRTDDAS